MRHVHALLKALLLVAVTAGVSAWSGFWAVGTLVERSDFRLALAANAQRWFDGREVTLVVGDSRLMDGVNAAQWKHEFPGAPVFNAAFNGLEFRDVRAVVSAFARSCHCRLARVIVDETALEDLTPGISDVRNFLAAFDPDVGATIRAEDPVRYLATSALPLAHFNNEVTHRSLYYLALHENDQDHGNDYHFRVPDTVIHGLVKSEKKMSLDPAAVASFARQLRDRGAMLIVVVAPQHGVYVRHRRGYENYREQVGKLVRAAGGRFQDDAALFADKPEYFADLIHLNLDGQREYTRHLATSVAAVAASR